MEIRLEPLSTHPESIHLLENRWKQLESASDTVTFFTSWFWIGCWLPNLKKETWLLEIEDKGKLVALGIFIERETGIWPFNKKQLWMNKTGEQKLDQMWVEYNDLIVHRDYTNHFSSDLWQTIFDLKSLNCQEVHVDITKHRLPHGFNGRHKMQTEGFLKHLDEGSQDILSTLSRNTRQQINRSRRLLEQRGELMLTASYDSQSRRDMLAQISVKHKEQWGNSEWGSGFDNPAFCDFHEKLIEQSQTVLLKLSVGETELAFGYYFYFRDSAYFYLSAIERDKDNKIKVGLVFHVMAMKYFQDLGFKKYDFLGGDARYKASLSDYSYPLYSWCLSRKNWITTVEAFARKMRRLIGK